MTLPQLSQGVPRFRPHDVSNMSFDQTIAMDELYSASSDIWSASILIRSDVLITYFFVVVN